MSSLSNFALIYQLLPRPRPLKPPPPRNCPPPRFSPLGEKLPAAGPRGPLSIHGPRGNGPPLNPLLPLEGGGSGPPRQGGKGAPMRGRKFGPSYSYIMAGCGSVVGVPTCGEGPFGPDDSLPPNVCGPFGKRVLFLLELLSSWLCSSKLPFVDGLFNSLPDVVELINSSNCSFSVKFTSCP